MNTRAITLIYSYCEAKRSGDFAIAGEIAYAIHTYYQSQQIPADCYLTSFPAGVQLFQNLFGNETQDSITIHNTRFTVMAYDSYVASAQASYTINLIQVGCFRPSQASVKELVDKAPQMQFHIALLPHISQSYIPDFANKYFMLNVNFIPFGIGINRIGIGINLDPPAPILHEKYHNLTRSPFALAYFNVRAYHPEGFLCDFFNTSSKYKKAIKHFITVGNRDVALTAIFSFMRTKVDCSAMIYQGEKMILFYFDKNSRMHLGLDVTPLHQSDTLLEFLQSNAIRITFQFVIEERLSKTELWSLMYHAAPLIGVTGISSTIEALALGKIPFYQFLEINKMFFDDYMVKMLASITNTTMQKNMYQTLQLLCWKNSLTIDQTDLLISLLNDAKLEWIMHFLNKNMVLDSEKFGKQIAKYLKSPSQVASTLFNSTTTPTLPSLKQNIPTTPARTF